MAADHQEEAAYNGDWEELGWGTGGSPTVAAKGQVKKPKKGVGKRPSGLLGM